MSELTKRLEGSVCYASTNKEWPNVLLQEAADRIEALEECLLEFLVAWDMRDDLEHELALTEAIDKARALLESK